MSASELVSNEDAKGKVAEIYEEIRARFGKVPNFFRAIAGADPEWLALTWQRWKQVMGCEGNLDRKAKELIALTVSLVRDCEYCSNAHEAMALMQGASRKELVELKQVVELFESFTRIADSLNVPVDIDPESVSE